MAWYTECADIEYVVYRLPVVFFMLAQLDIDAIKQNLHTSVIGREMVYVRKTESTNIDALQLAEQGAAEGTVVIADEQTGGKGRFNRTWLSRAGENILISIMLRPRIALARSFHLTMIASLAVVRAIEQVADIKAKIKWPNDVLIGGRKVCGILTELQGVGRVLDVAVIGIGINVRSHPDVADTNAQPATNLAVEAGKEISRTAIIGALLNALDQRYQTLRQGDRTTIANDWRRHSLIMGKLVTIADSAGGITGLAESIDDEGRLILLLKNGSRKKIISGDVALQLK